ncbi:Scarecrow-like protein 5 [Citrus sinensis]|uniref:scarecrow-like transcription factor PAT1 isoform X1 n=2 Tax=Citrus sinensis TaxID=2711 RepID=UPI0003D75167|nr:scarecrow-like transcription factor PAT1 isoform X1 [Citrus sinensis]XP_015384708.1 scarecrow-like transcription factor PAT1 isoform X1 [Citrus sinensis]KAH9652166.1 Scarecrow-like protein 5 [Citrus sinensis]
MQFSRMHKMSDGTQKFYDQPVQKLASKNWPPHQNIDHQPSSDDSNERARLSVDTFEQYCTLESSSGTGSHGAPNSPSTASFSPEKTQVSWPNQQSYSSELYQSPDRTCGSPVSGSCITQNENDLRHKLRELETVMLGPDLDTPAMYNVTSPKEDQISSESERWKCLVEIISRGDLKELLCACAKAIENNDMYAAESLMAESRQMVSVSGDPIQRLGAYMLEGLIARLASSGSSIYKALRCKEPASAELLSYMHLLYEICPYFKFGYMSANGAIAEAMKDENKIHIIDFLIAQGSQWIILIMALASRPGGPPHIRITGIDDSTAAYARGGGLEIVGQRLSKLADLYKVPFEFNAAAISGSEVQLENLEVRPGEALAVNFSMMLHHMPDESVSIQNHRDRLLRLVKGLSPKVVTLVEQEANTNTAPFFHRFLETMNHYGAIFDSIDVALPRDSKDRINVEQHCLAREIVNLIACEGAERVERHEPFGKWRSRFIMAGFTPYPLSPFVNATIKTLLENYNDNYTLEERDGALFLGWKNQAIIVSSAWR